MKYCPHLMIYLEPTQPKKNGKTFGDFAHAKWLNSQPLQRTASSLKDVVLPKQLA